MKKLLSFAAIASLFLASQASAITYNDYDIFDGDGIAIAGKGGSHTGTFDIVNWDGGLLDNVGYNSGAEDIVSAVARFAVGGLGFGKRYYDINIGAEDFASGSFSMFFVGGTGESGDVVGNALLTLSATGAVDYTITNNSSKSKKTFSLAWAKLDVETRKGGGNAVPDTGSSLALLGLGLLGLVGLRRRFSK